MASNRIRIRTGHEVSINKKQIEWREVQPTEINFTSAAATLLVTLMNDDHFRLAEHPSRSEDQKINAARVTFDRVAID